MDTDVATAPVLTRATEIADLARGMADEIDSGRRLPTELVEALRDSGLLRAGAPVEVDISRIPPGELAVIEWRGKPVWVLRRTKEMIESLKGVEPRLSDPQSKASEQPKYAENEYRSREPDVLVLVGVCTHLQCIPAFSPERGSLLAATPGGYLCHCHGSKYDLAGRVFKGVPAPLNLPVPPHHFPDGNTLVIGENPAGETFDLSQVQQL